MFWRHVSAANPSRRDIPDLMREDGKKASGTKEKAYLLNSSFSTNFSALPTANTPPPLPEKLIPEPMVMPIICKEDVKKRLKKNLRLTKLLDPITYTQDC